MFLDIKTQYLSHAGAGCQYRQLREELVAYARSLGMGSHDAEDIVHSVLLKAWEREDIATPLELSTPYLKVMVKNLWIDGKRGGRTDLWPEEEFVHSEKASREEGNELLDRLEFALEKHKYGYIILEMEKRGLRRIKELAPFANEKKGKLYKRYQKLVKDLRAELLEEG